MEDFYGTWTSGGLIWLRYFRQVEKEHDHPPGYCRSPNKKKCVPLGVDIVKDKREDSQETIQKTIKQKK